MNAIAGICNEEIALQEKYKEALAEWSATRARNPLDLDAKEASTRLEEIERKLKNHRAEHGC